MSTPIVICDDSNLARKQMASSLPSGWDVAITFASNGAEGLEAIKAGKGDVLFLDLNMPVMDGYAVLEAIRGQDLPTLTIVVSGDIQPQAQQRVCELGALDFIQKPVNPSIIAAILDRYGIRKAASPTTFKPPLQAQIPFDKFDAYREIANVAMGRAASLLATLMDAFVLMPIPQVNMIEASELHMALDELDNHASVSAVCQGFIGSDIAGEALLVFNSSNDNDLARLMNHDGELDNAAKTELLIDVSSIVVGACLKGLTEQLEIQTSLGPPVLINRHTTIGELIRQGASRWQRTLAIEMVCDIEHHNISCVLLLLFTEDSIAALDQRVALLVD